MTALDHALKWIDGELVAGGALVAFGLLLAGCGGLLWRFGESAAARAMVTPLLVMGGLIAALSAVGTLNNVRRIAEFREAYAVDPSAFVEQEVARVQGFMSWYVYTFVSASILIVAGLAAFLIVGAPLWKAIGLAMIVLGATALHVDFLSKASATQYLADLALLDGAPAAAERTPASSETAIRRGGTTRDAGESAGDSRRVAMRRGPYRGFWDVACARRRRFRCRESGRSLVQPLNAADSAGSGGGIREQARDSRRG